MIKARASITLSFMVDIKAVYRYYKLQSSTLSTPDAPTSYPPVGWTDAEPNYTSGSTQTLYTTDCTVFTDDSFVYSKVSKSSSYEAAKEAYNKAQAAQNTANQTQENLDNLAIGGRNMIQWTERPIDMTFEGNENDCTDSRILSQYYYDIPTKSGLTFTLSFKWETDATSGKITPQWNDAPWVIGNEFLYSPSIEVSETNQNGLYTFTFVADSSLDTNTNYWGIQFRTDYLTGNLKISEIQLELGDKATTWNLAPEDVTEYISDASKTATNYMDFSEASGLVIGDMTSGTLGKNVQILSNGVNIRNGETVLASFTDDGLDFEKPVVFSADGIMLNNGDAFTRLGQNQILWEGAYYMHGSQSINLNANITRQLSGAVFVWSYYDGVSALDQDFTYFFVPKSHIEKSPGDGIRMSDPYLGMMKYLYVSNGIVSGHANNASSGTTNGIAWANKNYVLRYVIGV